MPALLGLDLTDKEAFGKVGPLVTAMGIADECKPLLKFLLVAMTRSKKNNSVPIMSQTQTHMGVAGYSVPAQVQATDKRRSCTSSYQEQSRPGRHLLATPLCSVWSMPCIDAQTSCAEPGWTP